jgi:hypothetical protein
LLKIYNIADTTELQALPNGSKDTLSQVLTQSLRTVSTDAIKIREVEKNEYALQKFIERGGEDWRKGKFAFVVSAIKAFLHDIRKYLNNHLGVIRDVCSISFSTNGAYYSNNPAVNLHLLENFRDIKQNISDDKSRKTQQRSDKWFEVRQTAVVTGSTLYQAARDIKKCKNILTFTSVKRKVQLDPLVFKMQWLMGQKMK